jgi:hypothetical protein
MAREALVFACAIYLFAGCRNDSLVEEKEPPQTEVSLRHWFQLAYRWDGSLDKELPEPARSALEQADELELISLHPSEPAKGENTNHTFYKPEDSRNDSHQRHRNSPVFTCRLERRPSPSQ